VTAKRGALAAERNAVAPGTIRTERVQRLPEEPGGTEYIRAIEQMHPMGRLGEPAEVAQAIAFLLVCASAQFRIPVPPRFCCVGCSGLVRRGALVASTSTRCPSASSSACTPAC
jgi:hypothetical protein